LWSILKDRAEAKEAVQEAYFKPFASIEGSARSDRVRWRRAGSPEDDDRRRIRAGLLPIMWTHVTGVEVMQRIAVPMIGGMV
jgi:hypothetical protein